LKETGYQPVSFPNFPTIDVVVSIRNVSAAHVSHKFMQFIEAAIFCVKRFSNTPCNTFSLLKSFRLVLIMSSPAISIPHFLGSIIASN